MKVRLILVSLLIACASWPTLCCDQASDSLEKVQSAVPAYVLTAEQLAEEFHKNAVATNLKYEGKVIVLQGEIVDIQHTAWTGEPYVVSLNGTLDVWRIGCWFSSAEQSSVAQLVNGQHVRIKGVYRCGIAWPALRRCRLQ